MRTTARQTTSILLLGCFLCCFWYSAGYLSAFSTPVTEPDASIYWQYARSAAQGHPFSYTPPDGPSTGCTSTLYPLLIAPLYTLVGSDHFPDALFAFQALLFLISLGFVASIANKLIPENAWLALLATALSGQTLYTFLGMTDMGLLIAATLFCAWALIHQKYKLLCAGAVLCGITHPASLAVAAGLILAGVWQASDTDSLSKFLRKLFTKQAAPLHAGLCGVAAVALTMVLNYQLTGSAQFMSLSQKGLFNIYSPLAAIHLAAQQFVELFKGLFFGLDNTTRQLFFLPVLAGGLALYGLLVRPWKQKKNSAFDIFVTGAWIAGLGLMSLNERQNISFDRYAAWMFPLMYLYTANGIQAVARFRKPAARGLTVLFLGIQIVSLLFFTTTFMMRAHKWKPNTDFLKNVMQQTKPGDRIGIEAMSGVFWYLPEREIFHLYGMFNPELALSRHQYNGIETLKYEPELRPEYWITLKNIVSPNSFHTNFVGRTLFSSHSILNDDQALVFHLADWSRLYAAPPQTPPEWTMKQRLDIGYPSDEKQASYRVNINVPFTKTFPVICIDQLNGSPITECGELILGSEQFQLQGMDPARPLYGVLRTRRHATVRLNRYQASSTSRYKMAPVIRLQPEIDGILLPQPVVIHLPEEGFTDAFFTIPPEYIKTSAPKISMIGDHLSYAYWFFQ